MTQICTVTVLVFVFPLPPLKLSPCRQIDKAGINEDGGEKKRGEVSGASRVYCRNKRVYCRNKRAPPDGCHSDHLGLVPAQYRRRTSS